jgi:hypothetical protein
MRPEQVDKGRVVETQPVQDFLDLLTVFFQEAYCLFGVSVVFREGLFYALPLFVVTKKLVHVANVKPLPGVPTLPPCRTAKEAQSLPDLHGFGYGPDMIGG